MAKEEKYILKDGHQLREVFFPNDTNKYYEFVDGNSAPCHRMYAAMTYYNELNMRCDRDYLIAHTQAVLECLNPKKANEGINLTKIGQLTIQLKERLEWILEPESILKYASVMIFDESENPYDYDYKYNADVKIKRWKEAGLSSFFLSMPVRKLFPALDLSKEDLDIYLKVQEDINQTHLQDIFTSLSTQNKTKNWYNTLELRKAEVQP